MKNNTTSGRDFLKGPRKKCEDCGFSIPIPRGIPDKARKLECPECGTIYQAWISGNTLKFIKFQKDNK